ncbi:MAG: respiratory nitrate reductase subunit gamma [Pseudomonadales bacterium]|jgi:nitrate reductase gamma subunit|nr:respiratory nitrate reductase subunit gamma [Pseudomonadales bacterium]MDP6472439.1 respiratory nitrate reductase subunit gamma [Pseudomonadales bacterium]MDP6828235.1 respiratory nitrate reductase subunit gamma [Pseudomonadales bacterium]MDP6971396.1 respiratory nitrate reductase subunit gamma [Pseudomonadales bacterium]|tara:strand:+ start:1622 stop:2350 length:729 start_codon:yes stop_codon:yes gene_type:complete
MTYLDTLLFVALPYVAIVVFLVGTIGRYTTAGFSITSLSAQFLEGRSGFWGTVPFHIGILILFLGHLFIFLFPDLALLWNSNPVRLIIHEGIAFTFGLVVLVAIVGLLIRRWTHPRLRMVTSPMDIAIELMLLFQVVLGCWVALGYRWGSSWFAADLSPYLWSILSLSPETDAIAAMPWVIKLHVVGAFIIVLIFPFTRLVHFLVAPLHYLWRPYQVVMWYWDRKKIRRADTAWQSTRPHNN